MLDFVPNHMGLDHPWVEDHPEYFIPGPSSTWPARRRTTPGSNASAAICSWPTAAIRTFPGWPDTLQLNYANPATQEAMIGELVKIAGQCDGVRCDMAMLVSAGRLRAHLGPRPRPSGRRRPSACASASPGFLFMAEVYWDLEWTLQQQGFDYAYDKRLYDRLREGTCPAGARAFPAGLDYQDKTGPFPGEPRRAAGGGDVLSGSSRGRGGHHLSVAGPAFLHQGQFEGRKKRISPHLSRGPSEPVDQSCRSSTTACSRSCVSRISRWPMAIARMAAPPGKATGPNDCFLVFAWQGPKGERRLVAVNYAPNQSQCHVRLPFADLGGKKWQLQDQLSGQLRLEWRRSAGRGLFLDMAPWQASVFLLGQISAR